MVFLPRTLCSCTVPYREPSGQGAGSPPQLPKRVRHMLRILPLPLQYSRVILQEGRQMATGENFAG